MNGNFQQLFVVVKMTERRKKLSEEWTYFTLLFINFITVNKYQFCISVIGYINVQIIGIGSKKSISVNHYLIAHICHAGLFTSIFDESLATSVVPTSFKKSVIIPVPKNNNSCLNDYRQLRKFRVSPAILKTFYSGAIESVLTQCISVWYNNATNQDCKALQRVVRLAERISGSALPSLQDIYLKRCKSRAAKIIKDSTHPGNHHFCLLPSGKRFRSMMAKTERLRRSFFPQAIRLLNSVS